MGTSHVWVIAKKKELISALKKTLGVVQPACEAVEINRSTYYKWLKEDPEFEQAVTELGDLGLDYAESQLFKRMQKGSDAAVIFYLKTKGKKRGYIERQEFQLAGDTKIVIQDETE